MEVILSVISYSFCSGSLVLVNKLILHYIPFPSLVIAVQLLSCLLQIYTANALNIIPIDEVKWEFLKPYLVYTLAFSLGVYCNMKSLSMSNVETVIVFRSLAPLVVSFLEAAFLGRELPSMRSLGALSLIALGATGYANSDESFQSQGVKAYIWPFYYLATISFEMVYGKQIVKSVKFKTFSGPVQYTNLLGWPPCLLFAALGGEFQKLNETLDGRSIGSYVASLPPIALWLLVLGCFVGTAIGYSSWWCRDKISATSFTLVGVMNKCLTVLVNCFIWDQHANASGIACLFVCLIGGAFYQQAPMRKTKVDEKKQEETKGLLIHSGNDKEEHVLVKRTETEP